LRYAELGSSEAKELRPVLSHARILM
jgi:hypothetical protein